MHQDEKKYLEHLRQAHAELNEKLKNNIDASATIRSNYPNGRYMIAEALDHSLRLINNEAIDIIEDINKIDKRIKSIEQTTLTDFVETKIGQYEAELTDHVGGEDDHTYISGKIAAYEEMLKELEK